MSTDRVEYENLLPEIWEAIENYNIDFVAAIGEELSEMLKDEIKAQSFDHRALNRVYKEWKIKSGLDPRILIATGRMVDKITYRVELAGEEVQIGIFGDKRNATLLRFHEFGTRTIPERSTLRVIAAREHQNVFDKYFAGLKKILDETTV